MPNPAPVKAGALPFVVRTGERTIRLLQHHPIDGLVLWAVGNPWPKMYLCDEVSYAVARITLINGDADTRENVEFEIAGYPVGVPEDATKEQKETAAKLIAARMVLRRFVPWHHVIERETMSTSKDFENELRERAAAARDKDVPLARAFFEDANPTADKDDAWDALPETQQAIWIEKVVNLNIRANALLVEEDEALMEDEGDTEEEAST